MTENTTLIEFPCHFPIKIIGVYSETFFDEISAIIAQFCPEEAHRTFQTSPSSKGSYISITATVYVEDKPRLDALYMTLTKHPQIKMVL